MANTLSVAGAAANPSATAGLGDFQVERRFKATLQVWALRDADSALTGRPISSFHEGLRVEWADSPVGLARFCEPPSDSEEPIDLADLWHELTSGRARIIDTGYSPERCWLLLESRTPEGATRALNQTKTATLARVLQGEAQKVVADDLKLAVSTVATVCSQGLLAMGSRSLPSRAPLLLMLAAHALLGRRCSSARAVKFISANRELRVVTADRPGLHVRATLTAAERDVVALLLEGHSHEQIGAMRGTANRTIANQLAGIYRKLGVSGRGALIAALVAA
jgi:DNA-binding CsgD family transcriptional regulator